MTKTEYIIGIDIGTTSTKTVLFNSSVERLDQYAIEYPLLSPQPDVQEQDPNEIFAAVVQGVREVVRRHVDPLRDLIGLSFSAAMHSLIAVDNQGQPLTRSITWADRRSTPWVTKIKQTCDAHDLYARTGTPLHPMSPLAKLLWLRHEAPDLFQHAAKFVSIKEYVLYRWFNQYVVDYSIANATGLFNMATLDWDDEALAIAHITPERLSQLVPTTHILTPMAGEWANAMGIPADIPVVIGASDGVLANLGVGAVEPGVVAVTVGTSGAVRAVLNRPHTDPQERLFCCALAKDCWVMGGATNNGGIILRWLRDHLADAEVRKANQLNEDPYDILTAIAATVPAGSEGLIFHPYLAGERSPLWDANARGSFFGLALHHTKAHLIRAVLEGIVYNLYGVLDAVQDVVGPAKSIQATGGFARSLLWRQMLADVFDQTVTIPKVYESSCFGAAVLGLYALGRISTLNQVSDMIGETDRHHPIPENVKQYQKMLPLYVQLLEQFKPLYEGIAHTQMIR